MAPQQPPPSGFKLVYLWLTGRFLGGFLLLILVETVLMPLVEAGQPAPAPPTGDGFAAGFDEGMDAALYAGLGIILDFWASLLPLLFVQLGIVRALAAPGRRWHRLARAVSLPYLVMAMVMAVISLAGGAASWKRALVGLLGTIPYLAVTLAAATLLYRNYLTHRII